MIHYKNHWKWPTSFTHRSVQIYSCPIPGGKGGSDKLIFFLTFCNLFPLLQERKCQTKSEKTPALPTPIQNNPNYLFYQTPRK